MRTIINRLKINIILHFIFTSFRMNLRSMQMFAELSINRDKYLNSYTGIEAAFVLFFFVVEVLNFLTEHYTMKKSFAEGVISIKT